MEKLFNKKDLAGLLGKSERTLQNWIYADKYHLRSKHMFQVGLAWRINAEGYENLIDEIRRGLMTTATMTRKEMGRKNMAFPKKYLPVTRIISKQEGRAALNEIVEGILEELGLENQLTEEWVLTLQYKELNPEYGQVGTA